VVTGPTFLFSSFGKDYHTVFIWIGFITVIQNYSLLSKVPGVVTMAIRLDAFPRNVSRYAR
jgi:hypothetical protein